MSKKAHVEAYLSQRWLDGERIAGAADLTDKILEDQRRLLSLSAELRIKTSVLIRANGSAGRSPDMVHLTEAGHALLSGSALGGALRHRVEKIANTCLDETSAAAAVVRLFGPLHESRRGRGEAIPSGHVTVEEAMLENGGHHVQGRVALDRAFQCPITGALFDEATYWPNDLESVNWRFDLSADLTPYEDQAKSKCDTWLLGQAFKDLILADLPIGGEAGGGRGISLGINVRMYHPDVGKLQFRMEGEKISALEGDWEKWKEVLTCPA